MQRIHEPAGLGEGELLVAMLGSEGISAHLLGQHLLGALGELPASGLLAILVADEDVPRARALIAAYNAAEPLPAEPPVADDPGRQPGVLLC
ncbi:Putative signal transducing protein [Pseudomonas linyingensis]|jgi:hypothetical protein|uniref:Signal transducing protein n=1 Tax=Pseudomonas linyingensis TaxID=915471 RepID=A0A1H6S8S6_9PSED|nr:DUF2007 domain-containing protein [Pseudomonas linyingensis]SEI64331.1 Putative signal transducing protein [Pseudomonas linyingensis]